MTDIIQTDQTSHRQVSAAPEGHVFLSYSRDDRNYVCRARERYIIYRRCIL
jgi:hypothetical protein